MIHNNGDFFFNKTSFFRDKTVCFFFIANQITVNFSANKKKYMNFLQN